MFRSATYIPHKALRPFIACYRVNDITAQHTSNVLPDLSVVMGFQYGGDLSLVNKNGKKELERSCLTGMSGTVRQFENSAGFSIILVYFTPIGASAFFDIPLNEIYEDSISLSSFLPGFHHQVLEEELTVAGSDQDRIALINAFFLNRALLKILFKFCYWVLVSGGWFLVAGYRLLLIAVFSYSVCCIAQSAWCIGQTLFSSMFYAPCSSLHASQLIRNYQGNLKITALASELCMSQGRLEKRFRKAVGCSPKKYAAITRLTSITQQLTSTSDLYELAYDHGYYDQSHFNRDFKRFTGKSPRTFLREKHMYPHNSE